MTRWSTLVGAAIGAAGFVSQQPATPPPTGLILGRVVDASSGAAIPDVVVTLRPTSGNERETLTASDGEFLFRQVARGSYQLSTEKNGYLAGRLGAGRPGSVGQRLEIGDAERIGDLTVRIWKPGAIEGTILDEAGEPLVSVAVSAWLRRVVAGRVTFEGRGTVARTDDRGIYRLSGLTPGEYAIGVASTQSAAPAAVTEAVIRDPDGAAAAAMSGGDFPRTLPGTATALHSSGFIRSISGGRPIGPPIEEGAEAQTYATTFHPSTPSLARAETVVLRSGEERAGVDVRLKPTAAANVSGRLTGPPDAIAYMPMTLLPGSPDERILEAPIATTVSDATGAFTFVAVPRGDYIVRALRLPRLPDVYTSREVQTPAGTTSFVTTRPAEGVSPAPTWWASVPTTVGDSVSDLVIPLSTGARLRGRVALEGSAPKLEAGRWLTVEPADGQPFLRESYYVNGWVNSTGEFETPELPPGRYVIRIGTLRWTLTSAITNGRDVVDDGVVIGSEPPPDLLVTLSDARSRVSGVVRSAQTGVDADAAVMAFPLDRRLWTGYGQTPRRLQIVRTDRLGAYTFEGLPSGSYAVVAVPDAQTSAWPSPEFLTRLAVFATRVDLAAGEQKSLDLQGAIVR